MTSDMDEVRRRLIERRRELRLSQLRLAERMGLNQGNISAAESGQRWHTVDQLQRWAEALDMSFQMTLVGPSQIRRTTAQVGEIRGWLVDQRVRLDLTQRELAGVIGVVQSNLCAAERGLNWRNVSQLKRWANALGMRLEVTTSDR